MISSAFLVKFKKHHGLYSKTIISMTTSFRLKANLVGDNVVFGYMNLVLNMNTIHCNTNCPGLI